MIVVKNCLFCEGFQISIFHKTGALLRRSNLSLFLLHFSRCKLWLYLSFAFSLRNFIWVYTVSRGCSSCEDAALLALPQPSDVLYAVFVKLVEARWVVLNF